MENLTKENFFNEMMQKYPKAMDKFCKWIDQYKKDIMWNDLFFNSRRMQPLKFHDVPLALQMGILYQFIIEEESSGGLFLVEAARSSVEKGFKELESNLIKVT